MRYGRGITALVSLSVALTACDSDSTAPKVPVNEPLEVIEASGDLTAALADFTAAIGEPANGGGAGPQPGGRREIRWDAVPAERTNTDDFPIDFFNVTVQSGLITTTDGTGFRVSDNDFADLKQDYADARAKGIEHAYWTSGQVKSATNQEIFDELRSVRALLEEAAKQD